MFLLELGQAVNGWSALTQENHPNSSDVAGSQTLLTFPT